MGKPKIHPLRKERQRFIDSGEDLGMIDLTKFVKDAGIVLPKGGTKAATLKTGYNKGHLDGFTGGYGKGKDEWWDKGWREGYDEGEKDPRRQLKEVWGIAKILLESGYRLGFWINFDETVEKNGLEFEVRQLRPRKKR